MTTRSNRFIAGILTGYGNIAVSVLIVMASVPLALHYLSTEGFGLWILALQINGYLNLLELGAGAAIFRFVADHKDDVDGGEYGSLIITGGLVFAIQGIAIGLLGICLAYLAPSIFAVPAHLSNALSRVMVILAVISSVSIILRTLSAPLWAFQRMDVLNGCGMLEQPLRLALMWIGFKVGLGIDSLAWSLIPPLATTIIIHGWVCWKNGYYPRLGHWGRPRWDIFKEIFHYGKDGLLLAIGGQLVNATQITIISRTIGLDAAATFSIATKLYAMAQQVFHKVIESAAPGLTEIFIRGEIPRFVLRYWDAIAITLSLATLGAVVLATGNSAFIAIWTGHSISWSLTGDFLLGLLVVITSLSRCFVSIFGMIKDLRRVRILYFAEGIMFVPCAIFGSRWFGLEGVLGASLLAHLSITLLNSANVASNILGSCKPIIPKLLLMLVLTSLGSTIAWAGLASHLSDLVRLALCIPPFLASVVLVWFFILTDTIRLQAISILATSIRHLRNSFSKA